MILNICKCNHLLISWHDSDQVWTAQCLFLYVASERWSKKALSMMVKKNTANEGSALGCSFFFFFFLSFIGPLNLSPLVPFLYVQVDKQCPPKNNLPLLSAKHYQSCTQGWSRHPDQTGCTASGIFPWHLPPCFAGGSEEEGGSGEVKASEVQGKKHGAWWHARHSRFCFTRNC